MRITRIALALAVVALVGMGTSLAFHGGGVAECIGCHSMHNPNQLGSYLLNNIDQSSTCIDCHNTTSTTPDGYHVVSDDTIVVTANAAPTQRTPGGDFGWLKRTYSWSPPWGGTFTEDGDTHGHNVIADGYGYAVDGHNATAPGGSFNSNDLGCQACHDPHGSYRRLEDGSIATDGAPIIGSGSYASSLVPGPGEAVGVYRILAGIGYQINGTTFLANPPAAVAPDTYNQSEAADQVRVAYGAGMADWCATCHEDYHTDSGRFVHAVDQSIGSTVANNYNSYRGSGNIGGTNIDSYLSLVPYEENSTDYGALAALARSDDSFLQGPTSTKKVMCLSCHRAHASGFEYAIRWNPESELITYAGAWPGTDNGAPPQYARGRTAAEMLAAYNDYPATTFATYQRSLCNKCHVQD